MKNEQSADRRDRPRSASDCRNNDKLISPLNEPDNFAFPVWPAESPFANAGKIAQGRLHPLRRVPLSIDRFRDSAIAEVARGRLSSETGKKKKKKKKNKGKAVSIKQPASSSGRHYFTVLLFYMRARPAS